MSRHDRERWDHRHDGHAPEPAPSAFLAEHAALIPAGRVLDLAAGAGRNAAYLAARGHRVLAVDASRSALRAVRARSPAVDAACVDLDDAGFRPASVDAIVCINFLDRRLFPSFARWLRAGGVLVFDTFLVEQRALGHPRNPAFLLARGELATRLAGFRILAGREGRVIEGGVESYRSGVVAELRRSN